MTGSPNTPLQSPHVFTYRHKKFRLYLFPTVTLPPEFIQELFFFFKDPMSDVPSSEEKT